MAANQQVEVLVDGGAASAGPPLGPALGPLGINVMKVVQTINEKTRDFKGMKVPVKVIVDAKKNFEVTVGTPPTSALLVKELGVEKGSGDMKNNKIGSLTTAQIAKVARMKIDALTGATAMKRCKEVAGVCVSMGILIEGLDPREWQKRVETGEWADQIE